MSDSTIIPPPAPPVEPPKPPAPPTGPVQLPDDHPLVTSLAAVKAELKDARTQLKTAQDGLASAQAEAAKANGLVLRYEVAAAKGLDTKFASRLAGNTREEIEADADEFLAAIPGGQSLQLAPLNFGVGNRASSNQGGEVSLKSILQAAL